MTIHALDARVISRIAAGEVIERPASVVKELLENSLDAGARQITVEIEKGGLSLIRVSDDGAGISAAEMELAFQRYTTSKISQLEDLESIASLGFRGEALHSIAAVSALEVISRPAEAPRGAMLAVSFGQFGPRRNQERSKGTAFTIRELFRNVPARYKFLKSEATENNHIARVITGYALAYPEVQLRLTIDGRAILRTPGTGQLRDAVTEIYGLDASRQMRDVSGQSQEWVNGSASYCRISGMAALTSLYRSGRDHLNFFVNRRWVQNPLLGRAVEEAYRGLLPAGKHPVAVINLELPAQDIDVNVHPAKTEIGFAREKLVFMAVQNAIRQTLAKELSLTPASVSEVPRQIYRPENAGGPNDILPEQAGMESLSPLFRPALPVSTDTLPDLTVVAQVRQSYIIAEGNTGIYLIDQHAAHERVLYETIEDERRESRVASQSLLEAFLFNATANQCTVMARHLEEINRFGFNIEPFGDRSFLVRAVPSLLYGRDWNAVLNELLEMTEEGGTEMVRQRLNALLACHGAIRAGQALSRAEMTDLLAQLSRTRWPLQCPHGRPTIISLDWRQLEKDFHRT